MFLLTRLKEVLCLGDTASAYILTRFAVSWQKLVTQIVASFVVLILNRLFIFFLSWLHIKYKEQVIGLILVSPIYRAPLWTEWIYNKLLFLSSSHWNISIVKKKRKTEIRIMQTCYVSLQKVEKNKNKNKSYTCLF